MNIAPNVKRFLQDPLATFKWFERFFALFLISIPAILRITDKCSDGTHYPGWRSSISDYVYMWHSYVFGMLLSVAAMLFIFNGAIYFKNEEKREFNLEKSGKWYNIGLGLCLLGVVILPYKQYGIAHYTFATSFFAGNALVTGFFHTKKNRIENMILAILTIAALGLYFTNIFPWLTLFWAEWVSVAVVGVHFFLEAKR